MKFRSTGKNAGFWISLLLGLCALTIGAGGTAYARSSYLSTFNSTYGTSGTALNSCNTCHGSGGTSTFNPYGQAVRNGIGAGIAPALSSVEAADSDGDGFTNIVEINARTFPGDAASKPASPPPPPSDTTPPSVNSSTPADGAASVAVDAAVTARFSEAIDPATVSTTTFTLRDPAGAPVAGVVTVAGSTATYAPSGSLGNGVTYTASLTTGVKDLAGNALSAPHSWSFTTVVATADSDGDGVEDAMDAFPLDPAKASPPDPMGAGPIVIDTSGNPGTSLSMAGAMPDTSPMLNQSGKPAGYEFRNGVQTYRVEGVPVGGTVQVAITLPQAIPEGARVFKADSSGFQEYLEAQISGSTVLLTLIDGGSGDADGVADGSISDPVGVAFPVASESPSPAPGTSVPDVSVGGCSVAGRAGSPADGAAALLLMMLPAALLAVRRNARKV